MADEPTYAYAWVKAVEFSAAVGTDLKTATTPVRLPVDDQWAITMNPTADILDCGDTGCMPPFSIYVEFNGIPAGIIEPSGGLIAAGEMANEETFVAALDAQTKAHGGGWDILPDSMLVRDD